MTIAMIQKLVASMVVLTSFFLTFTFVVYYDLMRKLNNSILQLLPGLIIFGFGLAVSIIFGNPALVFKQLFPIKSGFAKTLLGSTVFPLISTTSRTLGIIGGLTSLIDKMWFYWRQERLLFLMRMISIVFMVVIAGNSIFKIIFTDPATIAKRISKVNTIGAWSGTVLGTILFLVTIMALPHIFGKKRNE